MILERSIAQGADYGNYILKSVAGCMKECLSDKQRIYHLVADQYVIVDLEASALRLQIKRCGTERKDYR